MVKMTNVQRTPLVQWRGVLVGLGLLAHFLSATPAAAFIRARPGAKTQEAMTKRVDRATKKVLCLCLENISPNLGPGFVGELQVSGGSLPSGMTGAYVACFIPRYDSSTGKNLANPVPCYNWIPLGR